MKWHVGLLLLALLQQEICTMLHQHIRQIALGGCPFGPLAHKDVVGLLESIHK